MKTNVLCFCHNMNRYNIGQYMTNVGLILASIGTLTAIIGNRVRINTCDDRIIIGGKKLEEKFSEMCQSVVKEGP